MKSIFIKIHETQGSKVLACCDKELIGKELKEGKVCFQAREEFYKGREVKKEELKQMLSKVENANLLGENSVAAALEQGIIKEENIIRIQGVPHVQIFKI